MLRGPILVRGSALRDEFSCPITRELMRDPVIAADGHTYDREAIEMWLRNHDTSPKTGQPMVQLSLVPNLNLRRLIKDLLNEGGEGLYVHHVDEDDSSEPEQAGGRESANTEEVRDYRFALVAEHILVLKCLGPTDSDWNDKSFRVTERGCVGGRKQPAMLEGADFMQFSDATVSRRHFGIIFDKRERQFSLCDFGSAGGTFVRLGSGVPTPLFPGMMIMLGKHQLEVTRVPADEMDRVDDTNRASVSAEDKTSGGVLCRPPRPGAPQSLAGSRGVAGGCCGLAGVKEGSATDQEEGGGQRERGRPSSALSGKSSKIEDGLSSLRIGVTTGTDGVSGGDGGAGGGLLEGGEHWGRQDSSRSPLPHHNAAGGEDDASVLDTPLQDMHGEGREGGVSDHENELEGLEKSFEAGVKLAKGHRAICLECFAPEGTPIQRSRFLVGKRGATLGRRQTNTIAFSHETNGTIVGIDASISGEHARIAYDEDGEFLHIMDGTPTKPSTNGTWFRLSGMHKESRLYPLSNGAEILIGTVRFSVALETMVVEKELNADNRDHFMSLVDKDRRTSPSWGAARQSGGDGRGCKRMGW